MGDYECGVCGDMFGTDEELEAHVKQEHSSVNAGDYECSICGARFGTKEELFTHVKDHPR